MAKSKHLQLLFSQRKHHREINKKLKGKNNSSESDMPEKKMRDLPKFTQFIILLSAFLYQATQGRADDNDSVFNNNLHHSWKNQTFQTNDTNQINFMIQFSSHSFPNINETTSYLLEKCGHLIKAVPQDWLNSVSLDWQTLFSFCNTTYVRTQAEAYMTFAEKNIIDIAGVSIPDEVWECLSEGLQPKCKNDFFIDWQLGFQILFVIGCAVTAITATTSVYKCLTKIWNQRTGYEAIQEQNHSINTHEPPKNLDEASNSANNEGHVNYDS